MLVVFAYSPNFTCNKKTSINYLILVDFEGVRARAQFIACTLARSEAGLVAEDVLREVLILGHHRGGWEIVGDVVQLGIALCLVCVGDFVGTEPNLDVLLTILRPLG